ncbi:MAG: hypothetical protein ABJ056_12015 [Halioglobus sp.]
MTEFFPVPIFERVSYERQLAIFNMNHFIGKNVASTPLQSSSDLLTVDGKTVEVVFSPMFHADSPSDKEIDLLGKGFWDFILNEVETGHFEELKNESRNLCSSINPTAGQK